MKHFLSFLLLISLSRTAFSQGILGDTMNTGSGSYILFHPGKIFKSYTARIEHDSLLVIYDSTGAR